MDSESIEAAAAQWIIRRHGEAWTDADQKELDSWLEESTFHRVAYLRLDSVWQQTDRLKALGAGSARGSVPPARSWTLRQAPEAPTLARGQRFLPRTRWVAVAASLILPLLASAYWFMSQPRDKPDEYQTAVGGLQTVRLADGSQVTLNTATHLRADLHGEIRRIELDSGEAFFVVAKDPARPFVVSVAKKTVTAVGTQFSVRRTAADIQVLVTQGRVALRVSSGGGLAAPTPLDAGSLASTIGSEVRVEHVSADEAERILNWRSGFVVFRRTPLADAVAELSRYQSRELLIADPALASIPITGKFRTNNLDAFLTLLQQGLPVTVETSDDRIVLKRRN